MSMKNPLTLAGIEPATFRFVAQHLNHCATAVPWLCTSDFVNFKCKCIYLLLLIVLHLTNEKRSRYSVTCFPIEINVVGTRLLAACWRGGQRDKLINETLCARFIKLFFFKICIRNVDGYWKYAHCTASSVNVFETGTTLAAIPSWA